MGMTTTQGIFKIECDGYGRYACPEDSPVIAESNSITEVFALAKAAGAEYDEVVDEWQCAKCLDRIREARWEAHNLIDIDPARYAE